MNIKYNCIECGEENTMNDTSVVLLVGENVELGKLCSACEWPHTITMKMIGVSDDYRDKEWLHNMYNVKHHTMAEIADQCGVTAMTIYHWLKKHEIPSRPRGTKHSYTDE